MQFNPMPRTALRPVAPACAEGLATARCIRLRELLEAAPCAESAPSPRLRAGRDGMQATVADRHRCPVPRLRPGVALLQQPE